jgi:hypothetical protein
MCDRAQSVLFDQHKGGKQDCLVTSPKKATGTEGIERRELPDFLRIHHRLTGTNKRLQYYE